LAKIKVFGFSPFIWEIIFFPAASTPGLTLSPGGGWRGGGRFPPLPWEGVQNGKEAWRGHAPCVNMHAQGGKYKKAVVGVRERSPSPPRHLCAELLGSGGQMGRGWGGGESDRRLGAGRGE
jgi:hypothetical protein